MSAIFSECGKYRYVLRRTMGSATGPICGWIMLNPSTVVNLFAYRATDPKKLRFAMDPVGEENDRWIQETLAQCRIVVAAWGAEIEGWETGQRRAAAIADLVPELWCLDTTKDGHPRHPLYTAGGLQLQPFKLRGGAS